ncbi:MAG: DUF1801 domain-containing protein [Acidimicrobiales bacterium]|nr:DUF1801 domain-containing protein [Acidimicrobiales bacterium]
MKSDATTVEDYLGTLPDDRREVIEAVRETMLAHLPEGFEETMQYGMVSYVVPLERYSEEGAEDWLRQRWTATGRKLDMGKSCVRFKRLDEVALDLVGEAIAPTSVDDLIEHYERSRT